MKTKKLHINQLEVAAELLKNGKIVAFPTETVFGMGIIFNNLKALEDLRRVKGRLENKPFTLVTSSVNEINQYAELSKPIKAVINEYMPGPLTVILRAKEKLIGPITNYSPFIGIRVSSDINVSNLIKLVGMPLLVPSANKSSTPPLQNSEEVYEQFKGEISAVITGQAKGSIASTVIKIDDKIELVREGEIPFSKILKTYEEAKK